MNSLDRSELRPGQEDLGLEFEGFIEATPAQWPKLFEQTPELLERLKSLEEGNVLYAALYTQRNPGYVNDFDTYMSIKPGLRGLREIACSSIQYPSNAIIESIRLTPGYGRYVRQSGYQMQELAELFEGLDATPNLRAGEFRFGNNQSLALYLAVRLTRRELMNPATNQPFSTVKELRETLAVERVPVTPQSLSLAFQSTATEDMVNMLLQKNYLRKDDLDEYFRNTSSWNVLLSLDRSLGRTGTSRVQEIFPFGSDFDPDQILYLDYLPFLAASLKVYIQSVPDLLPPGRIFPLPSIRQKAVDLRNICQKTITARIGFHDAEYVRRIAVLTQEQFREIQAEITRLGQNPDLWHKGEVRLSAGTIPSIEGIRGRIQESGGRAPKRMSFDIAEKTRKGSI